MLTIRHDQTIDRDGYTISPHTPTHATPEAIASLQALFTGWVQSVVDSDYNFANTPESFSVTFHDLTAHQVRLLAAIVEEGQ